MSTQSVLLVGASGAWGQPLVNEFINQKHSFKRVAILARSESQRSKFDSAKSAGIDVIVGSPLDARSYEGFDTVLLLVGNPVLRLQPAMVEAAVQAGVTHIYPSEWNSDIDNPAIANMRYFRDKMATRAHLHAVAKENPKVQYTIFITGIFTEWTLLAGWDHENKKAMIYGDPKNEIGSTSIPDIANATVKSILIPFKADQPSTFPGRRTVRIQGQRQPHGNLVSDLLAARGGAKYEIEYRDVSEAVANIEKARQNGNEEGEMFWSISTLPASGHGVADGVEGIKLNNDWFDIKWETQRQTLERMWGGK